MLWECMKREDQMQREVLELSRAKAPVEVLQLHTAKVRVVAKARAGIESRLAQEEE